MRRQILFLPAVLLPAVLLLSACGSTTDRSTTAEASDSAVSEAAPELVAVSIPGVPKVHQAGSLFLGAQPDLGGFDRLRESGIVRLVNLRHDEETPGFSEANMLPASGFEYVNLPWNGPSELTDQIFDQARALMADTETPTMLYCKSSNRVGAVWVPFRVLDQGIPLEQALEEAHRVGLRAPQYEQLAVDYIERHR